MKKIKPSVLQIERRRVQYASCCVTQCVSPRTLTKDGTSGLIFHLPHKRLVFINITSIFAQLPFVGELPSTSIRTQHHYSAKKTCRTRYLIHDERRGHNCRTAGEASGEVSPRLCYGGNQAKSPRCRQRDMAMSIRDPPISGTSIQAPCNWQGGRGALCPCVGEIP
jgi:hypothetical protein